MTEPSVSILVVDDDASDLQALKTALSAFSGDRFEVTDPNEVLDTAGREKPDVVVLDALLPGLSGFDLCKQIKSDAALSGTSVLIITGVYVKEQYRQEALQLFNADGFLTKPFRPPELQRIVAELMAAKTGRPVSDFLDAVGLAPAPPPPPKKRGFLDRLFRKSDGDQEVALEPAALHASGVATEVAEPEPTLESELEPALGPESEPELDEPPDPSAASEADQGGDDEPDSPGPPQMSRDLERPVSEESDDDTPGGEPGTDAPPESSTDDQSTDPDIDSERLERLEGAVSDEAVDPAVNGPDEARAVETAEEASEPAVPSPAPASSTEESVGDDVDPDPDPESGRLEEERVFEQAGELATVAPSPNGESREAAVLGVEPDASEPKDAMPIYDETAFRAELKRELARCRRVDRPLTLVIVRIEDLTQIVELFGSEVRGSVLRHVAKQASASLREVDVVGMIGSRDLVGLVAFAADKYGGRRVASRIQKALNKSPFRVGEELPPIVPALVFGIASYPDEGAVPDELIAAATDDAGSH